MNILEAKEEILRTFRAYTRKDESGVHRIPPHMQRPVLLIGPPGIGKTAIMRQIAQENQIGLVSYTMTHHTRQSAIGLPFLMEKEYDGRKVTITEYTMSEIIASIYEYINRTGLHRGILFLDEINCVSETLAPVMLQLLQNKTFGNHPLPPDWIIVAAGNPPEYNKSVREFDMVTLDRVKHMEIEADFDVWQDYARDRKVHPAVRSYLALRPDHFYVIANEDRGQLFVTARGWEDLSCILLAYEEEGEKIPSGLFIQYLQHDEIARSFRVYYEMYQSMGEEKDASATFSEMLLKDPARLASFSAADCLSVSSFLFEGIRAKALKENELQSDLSRLRDLQSCLPSDDMLRDEKSCRDFFRKRKEALRIRHEHRLVRGRAFLDEEKTLAQMEEIVFSWSHSAEKETLSEYLDRTLAPSYHSIRDLSGQIMADTEGAYRVLEMCPQGSSALAYLTTDLSKEPLLTGLLTENPPAKWLEYCSRLLRDG